MKIRTALAAAFLAGVLITGLGCGITFAEWSSFQYAGEHVLTLGEEREKTYVYDMPEEKINVYYYDLSKTKVEESKELTDQMKVHVVDYGNTTAELEGNRLYLWNNASSSDEIRLMFQCKDELLADLKEQKLHSYRTESVKEVTIYVPEGQKDMVSIRY